MQTLPDLFCLTMLKGCLCAGKLCPHLADKEAITALRMALARSYETKEPREALRRLGFYSH